MIPWAERSVIPEQSATRLVRTSGSQAMHSSTRAWFVRNVHSPEAYEYPSTTESRVHVAGLTEPNGFYRKVTLDSAGRLLTDTDATNRTATSVWDSGDRLLS